MSFNTTITPSMVTSLYVSPECAKPNAKCYPEPDCRIGALWMAPDGPVAIPCAHDCKITLNDGKEKETTLDTRNLWPIINAIAKEKISGLKDETHFFAQGLLMEMIWGKTDLQPAEETLTKLFQ